MHIKKGDKVIVIAGKDKSKEGIVSKVITKNNKVVVSGINMVKKNLKPNVANPQGGQIQIEAPIAISNVMLYEKYESKRKK